MTGSGRVFEAAMRDEGFSLIETIAAFVIFSLVFIALYNGLAISSRGARIAQSEVAALELARAKLAVVGYEIPLSDGLVTEGEENGLFWRVGIQKHGGDATPSPGVPAAYWATVEVTWQAANDIQARSISLTALKLAPRTAKP